MKKLGTIIFVVGLIFVGMGDSFLPKPLSTVSKNVRTEINNILLGFTPRDIEKPSKQREDQVEDIEERVRGNRDRLVEQP